MKKKTARNSRRIVSGAIALLILGGWCEIASSAIIPAVLSGAWTTAGSWSGDTLPAAVSADDFTVAGGFNITSPTAAATFTTTGDTLAINSTGTLSFPTTSSSSQTFTIPILTLDGGTLTHGSPANGSSARPITIAGTALTIGAGGATININPTGSDTGVRTLTISAPLFGAGNISRFSTGDVSQILLLSGNSSTFSGDIISEGAVLQVTNANALGNTTGTTTIRRSTGSTAVARLDVDGGLTMSENLIMDAGNGSVSLRPRASGTSALVWNGNITATTTINPLGTGSLRLEGNGTTSLNINGNIDGTTHNGAIFLRNTSGSGTAAGSVTGQINKPTDNIVDRLARNGEFDSWTLSNVNNIVGTFSATAGLTNLGANNALGNSGNGPALLMGQEVSVGKIDFKGFDQKISALGLDRDDVFVGTAIASQLNSNAHNNEITNSSIATTSTLTLLPNTITLSEYTGYATNQRFPGKITGNMNFVVSLNANDKLTFESDDGVGGNLYAGSANTYSGTTTINSGTLLVNGSHSGGAGYSVANGATLGGTGSIGLSSVLVASGGFLSPGASIESFTVGSADIDGTLKIEYDSAAIDPIDLLNVVANLDITNAIIDFESIGSALPVSGGFGTGAYVFASYGTLTGTFAEANVIDLPSGYYINYAYDNGVNSNNIAVVPEPGTFLVGAVVVLGLAMLRRRRVA